MRQLKFTEYLKRKWWTALIAALLLAVFATIGIQEGFSMGLGGFICLCVGWFFLYWKIHFICESCGAYAKDKDKFCPNCGAKFSGETSESEK